VATGIVPRRNSLGDLKIPTRISQAQVGLKRDLGMVREFAAEVESEFELFQSDDNRRLKVVVSRPQRDPKRLSVSYDGSPNCSPRA
jgi:hypothetical protein